MTTPDSNRDARDLTREAAAEVLGKAHELGLTIGVAESLTGGLLVGTLIGPGGATTVIRGGIVAYDTALKTSLLGVDPDLLAEHGPVHPEVARQMARGVRTATSTASPTDIGIATTGVAGPDRDPQTGAAVGTVYLGISGPGGDRAVQLSLAGSRDEIRAQTVIAALGALRTELNSAAETRV